MRRAFHIGFTSSGIRRDLDDEIRFHIESRVNDLIASGLDPRIARERAEREYGDIRESHQELFELDRRRVSRGRRQETVTSMLQDLRYATRQLRRAPLLSLFIIATLSIGIGATALMFAVVDTMVLRPIYRDETQLVRLSGAFKNRGNDWSVSLPNAADWSRLSHSFSSVAWYQQISSTLTGSGAPERINVVVATPSLFEVLDVQPMLGRVFDTRNASPDGERVVLLSHHLWQSHFAGDRSVIGKMIEISGRPATVIAVMPATLAFPNGNIDAYLALRATPATWPRSNGGLNVLARMRPGVMVTSAQRDLDGVSRTLTEQFPQDNKDLSAFVKPFREAVVGPDLEKALYLLSGAVMLVLLIACVNVASLLLARAMEREREIAVRAALGAGRGRVVRQLLTEGIVLALLGAGGGLALAAIVVRALPAIIPADSGLPRAFALDERVLFVSLLTTIATGVAFSVLPAIRATSADLGTLMGVRATRTGPRHQHRRDTLIVVEVALAVVLLAATGLAIRGLARLLHTDPGFRPEHLLTARVPVEGENRETTHARTFYDRLVHNLRAIPGVESASLVDFSPMSGVNNFNDVVVEGRDPHQPLSVGTIMIAPGYLETMGIPLLSGRDISESDTRATAGVTLINRALAEKLFPNESPVGKRVLFNWEGGRDPYWRTVIGVYGNVLHAGLNTDAQPQRTEVAVPVAQLAWVVGEVQLVARTSQDPQLVIPAVRRAVTATNPRAPVFNVKTMTQLISETSDVVLGRILAGVLAIFGAIAVLLAALGLYGVIAYSVTQRTFEIGVRSALGANRSSVLRMVLGEGVKLTVGGLAVGLVGAYLAARLLRSLLHGVSPTDPVALAGTCALLLFVTGIAALLPAWRASRIDPSVALRES